MTDDDLGAADRQMDGALMNTLLLAYPALTTTEEIQRELGEPEDWKVADSLNRLESAGLIHRFGAFIFPTRTAYHAGTLEYSS
jgi:hypothetical protein